MSKQPELKERLCVPTKFDIEPYGTIYKVVHEDKSVKYYIQLSNDGSTIDWKPLSYLFDEIFFNMYENRKFIDELLRLVTDRERNIRTFTRILESEYI